MSKKRFLFVIVVFALLIRSTMVVIFLPHHKYYQYEYGTHPTNKRVQDDHRYIEQAMNLVNGEGFPKSSEQAPFAYDFRRGPLYPLLLGSIFYFSGFNILYVLLGQALISSLSIIFIYQIALRYSNEKTARLSSVIWALFPPSIFWVLTILRETVITFLLLASIWAILAMVRRPDKARILLAGVATGLLLLQDPFAITIIPVLFLFILLHDYVKRSTGLDEGSLKNRILIVLRSAKTTCTKNLNRKLFIALLWVFTVFATISPWLFWTAKKLGRPVLGTASPFGVWDDWFTYYKFKSLQKNIPGYTISDFDSYMLTLRYQIAKKHISDPNFRNENLTSETEKNRLVFEMRFNPDFIDDLNSYNSINTFRLLVHDPSLYFGEPLGKTTVIKFFDYWLNFAVTFRSEEMPNISTLYVMTTASNPAVRMFAILSLILSFILFLIFIRNLKTARLLVMIWLTYFAFYNIVKFRAEARYTLPVQPLAIIVISNVLSNAFQMKNKKNLSVVFTS